MLRVEVVWALPHEASVVTLRLPDGATVNDAIAASGLGAAHGWRPDDGQAVFGEHVARERVLHDGDRIELLRPLLLDPKQARRLRAARTATNHPKR